MKSSGKYRRLVAVVYGQTGSGKTILARAVLRERLRALGISASGVVVDTLIEHEDLPAFTLDSFRKWLTQDRRPDLDPFEARALIDTEEDFSDLADMLEETSGSRGPVVLMVDEVSRWTSPGHSTPGLSRLIRYGRHWQIDLIGISQRAAITSRELSSQLTELYIVGPVVEPRDRNYFAAILPAPAMAKVDTLTRYHYLKYCPDGTYSLRPPVKIF